MKLCVMRLELQKVSHSQVEVEADRNRERRQLPESVGMTFQDLTTSRGDCKVEMLLDGAHQTVFSVPPCLVFVCS